MKGTLTDVGLCEYLVVGQQEQRDQYLPEHVRGFDNTKQCIPALKSVDNCQEIIFWISGG